MSETGGPGIELGRLEVVRECLENVGVDVSGRDTWDGTREGRVVDVETRAEYQGDTISFTLTVDDARAVELADELRDAGGVGRRTPDDRSIDDVAAVESCASCGWAPAATILVDGAWQCYNCGGDTAEGADV